MGFEQIPEGAEIKATFNLVIPNLVIKISLFSESAKADFALVAAVSTAVRKDINKIRFGIIAYHVEGIVLEESEVNAIENRLCIKLMLGR